MVQSRLIFVAAFTLALSMTVSSAVAVSPASVDQGKRLFEHEWQSRNPLLGNDGLGPLFNASSCIACHHQGGTGGAGDARFNAQAIGIDRIEFSRLHSNSRTIVPIAKKRQILANFYPGFVSAPGSILNTAPLPHRSNSFQYGAIRSKILRLASAEPSDIGGPKNSDDLRLRDSRNLIYRFNDGELHMVVHARVYDRNTTALFGAGLIDSISDRDIREQEKLQRKHREVSGRRSILRDGTVGRFGWRANVNRLIQFVDRACANELGLETKRRPQVTDPIRPRYRNVSHDIGDKEIESMTRFIAHLPKPIRHLPSAETEFSKARRGEFLFGSVGCAVCHVPDMGPAAGIYSDILLHDMGPYLFDFDAAEPYVVRQKWTEDQRIKQSSIETGYYGSAAPMTGDSAGLSSSNRFVSPRGSTATEDFITVRVGEELGRHRIGPSGSTVTAEFRKEWGIKRTLKASNTKRIAVCFLSVLA